MDFTVKTRTDRGNAKRVVPMKVLVLGMPRTGTNSLRDALKMLGFDECYHQATLIQNPDDGAMWMRAFSARGTSRAFKREDWDALLGHCQAVCDIPAVHFAQDLIDAYPEAKAILSTRDVDKWHRSVSQTIEKRYHSSLVHFLSFVDDVTRLWASIFYKGWGEMFDDDFEKNGRDVFHQHNAWIRRYVAPSRLLEYEVVEGWEPLCTFLDVPVPAEEFPKGNDQGDFHESCKALDSSRTTIVLGKATLCAAGLALCIAAWRNMKV
ncbi:hypothetical protein Slin15195_G083370 [Septoria linicola]|uniref:NAD dependent epimerase/dehydratase n=1 Tax=Septoria linicola TaxID=215465 RepID=A0A9Q9AZT0_9PEZI|nr:hypothetical protein Slin14017_G085880 [Septoria linicola]USW55018.1 hypothetical protein Slin15195_G083370 [Septoria linicola]